MPNPDLPTYAPGDPMPAADMDIIVTSLQGANEDIAALQEIVGTNTVYRAILNQSGSSAPTVTVLENTTGLTFTPSRTGTGQYKLTPSSVLIELKTLIFVGHQWSLASFPPAVFVSASLGNSLGYIELYSVAMDSGNSSDSLMKNISLEILIYP